MRRFAALAFAALVCACANSAADADAAAQTPPRTAWLVGLDGRAAGQATLTETPAGVLIRLEFSDRGLPSGWHGLHLHQHGDCSDFAAGFQAAGGHIAAVRGSQHGIMNTHGPEAGDLPNLLASPAGAFGAEVLAPQVTLGAIRQGNRLPLMDDDGAALVIHANPDDHVSQPIGAAGARIACAAFTRMP
jgi:Cu-Zn family superoxide dismutase